MAAKDDRPVASILTVQWRNIIYYKYGCSDAAYHNLGGMPFLLWKTIQEERQNGAETLDFGRSDPDNAGLIAFKERWGALQSPLTYWRHSQRPIRLSKDGYGARLVHRVFTCMSDDMLTIAGRLLYRHIG